MKRIVLSLFIFGLTVYSSSAQMIDLDELFQWDVQLENPEASAGSTVNVRFKLNVVEHHLTYKKMMEFKANLPEGISTGVPEFAKPTLKIDPTEPSAGQKEVYVNESIHTLPLQVSPSMKPGDYEFTVIAGYQGCSQTVCFFPQKREFTLTLAVTEGQGEIQPNTMGSAGAGVVSNQANESVQQSFTAMKTVENDFFKDGYFWTFLMVFVFGILTCFTPCVYPLIPITVSILGAHESKSKLQAFSLAFTYVLGIVVMYSSLGYMAASTGAIFGQFLSNPWVVGFIVAVFAAMGASMLGAFELQLPSSLQTKLTSMGGGGYGSAFFMGLVAGIIAAPCTGPMLVAILTFVATSGDTLLGVLLLMTYAFGLGMLFLVIGTFSGLITKMPKSGGWMESVKSIFGILLFAFALYYLKEVVTILKSPLHHSAANFVIAGIVFVIGLGLGAVHLSFHTKNVTVRARKMAGVIVCVGALYVGVGSMTAVQASNVDWNYSLDDGLALAKQENKPVMIDFYADWCAECKELEAYTFSADAVDQRLKDFVTIKVDLTKETEENQKIKELFGIYGLPNVAFFDSSGQRLDDKTILGFVDEEEFMQRIEDIQ